MKYKSISINEMYNMDEATYLSFLETLDESLNPRTPDLLFDKFRALNPNSKMKILDAGCRDARHLCKLAEEYQSKFVGIDLVVSNIEEADKKIKLLDLEDRIKVQVGDINHLPYDYESIDIIWCRDVLTHMPDLEETFKSFYRVMKSGGRALIFHMTGTELLTEEEARAVSIPVAAYTDNLNPLIFEKAYESAGFKCIEKDMIASEWRESYEETGNKMSSKQLLRLAKLIRKKDYYIDKFGEATYQVEVANCKYGIYQMLCKLCPIIYTLEK